jgi:hypothetical protein
MDESEEAKCRNLYERMSGVDNFLALRVSSSHPTLRFAYQSS